MQQSLELFAPEDSFRDKLRAGLAALASQGLFIGGSSWKYEGWLGPVYSPDRYRVKGRFSKTRFEQECLAEYAEIFSIVCGDFAFYQFPTAASWQKLFTQVPPAFQFAFKAPEEVTLRSFPKLPRYGPRAGRLNPGFLDAELFRTQFLDLLVPYRDRVAVIIFEFGAGLEKHFPGAESFAERLEKFFEALPSDFRFAVELRSPQFFTQPYFSVLRQHGAAHVFNAWSGMPEIGAQMSTEESFTAPFTVARALLRAGRPHNESVSLFAPYNEIKEVNLSARTALKDLLVRAKRRAEPTFIFVNNRFEGFAPGTIAALIEQFEATVPG